MWYESELFGLTAVGALLFVLIKLYFAVRRVADEIADLARRFEEPPPDRGRGRRR